MRTLRVCNPSVRAVADELERDEIERWSSSLPQARVTRWGGMISTPDEYLQVILQFIDLDIRSIGSLGNRDIIIINIIIIKIILSNNLGVF